MDLSIYITTQGMERMQKRINELMTERPEVIKAVAVAREFGDLSENAEYKAARERQRAIDSEIDFLRRRASTLKVVDSAALPGDIVRFGCECLTKDESTQEEIRFRLVGAAEVNLYEDEQDIQVVSVVSPIGRGLLGKKENQIAEINAPMGKRRLRVVKIY
ncbi:MAG: transcription elongation factor GreA [Candidatus Cloacimonetes bacterium]|nr:transcription elongation factor GreA [Candidatus Cloacimonadota bacterium]